MTVFYGLIYLILQLFSSFFSKRLAIAVFLISYPFLPYYVGLAIGSDNQAFTFKRMGLVFIFILFTFNILATQKINLSSLKTLIIFILLTWLITSFTVAINNSQAIPALIRGIEFILITYVGISLGQYIVKNNSFDFYIKYAFIIPFCALFILVFLEFLFQAPLFFDLLGKGSQFSDLGARAGFTRNDTIRVQASFADPIELSEYLILAMVGSLAFPWKRKVYKVGLIFMIILSILATGSRSGVISLVVASIIYIILKNGHLSINSRMRVLWFFLIISFIYGVFSIFTLASLYAGGSFVGLDADQSSIISRVSQFGYIFEALRGNYIFGLGYQRNFVTSLDLVALDNLFLWTALESGMVGLMCFLSLFFLAISYGSKLFRFNDHRIKIMGIYLLIFGSVYFLQKMLLLSPVNIIYFYIALGMMIQSLSSINSEKKIN